MHESRNIVRKIAAEVALALVWLLRAKQDRKSGLYAVGRKAADVADEEFAPVERRREHRDIGRRGEPDTEATLSAGKDFAT